MDNVRIFARHVEGKKNELADSLSRDKIWQFKQSCKLANKVIEEMPTEIPEVMWPMQKYGSKQVLY